MLPISNSRIIVGEHFRWKYILFGNRYLSVSLLVPRRNRKILEDDSTCSNRIPGFKHEASFPLSSKNRVEQKVERSATSFFLFYSEKWRSRAHTHTHTHTHTHSLSLSLSLFHAYLYKARTNGRKMKPPAAFSNLGRISEAAVDNGI